MKKNKAIGLYIKITKEESDMVKKMKKESCINISQLVRNSIRDFYSNLEIKNGNKKI